MTGPLRVAQLFAPFLLALGGCALLSRGAALDVRFYDPESLTPRLTGAGPSCGGEDRLAIELGRVASSATLREKVAYRERAFEVGFYEERRWTERPGAFVRRALARSLFEERCFRRAFGGGAPALEVEVVAFEEVLGPPRAARVRLRVILRSDRDALLEDTVTVERPVGEGGFDAFVQAMALALDEAAGQIATEAAAALRGRRREAPGAQCPDRAP